MRVKLWASLAPVVLVGFGLTACGSTGPENASAPRTVTVIERVQAEPAPERSIAADTSAVDEPVIDEEASSEEPTGGSSGSGEIVVPDVVGEDHQLAQDTMQAEGLYVLSEKDATGQDRMLIMDRNWTVVSQDPPAGSRVGADTEITLSSKKDDE